MYFYIGFLRVPLCLSLRLRGAHLFQVPDRGEGAFNTDGAVALLDAPDFAFFVDHESRPVRVTLVAQDSI